MGTLKVFVHSPHLLILEGLQRLVATTHEVVPLAVAEVAIRDLRAVQTRFPPPFAVPTLALLDQQGGTQAIESLRAGYRGYLHGGEGIEQLNLALKSLLRGENWAERHLVAAALNPTLQPRLTRRETQVYQLLRRAYSNKAIAEELSISVNTVKTHVSSILAEFRVTHRSELLHKGGALLETLSDT